MNFANFIERVLEEIQDYLPAEYENAEITTTKILKENVEKTGLNIRRPGETIVPTLHLEAFYEDYQKSEDFEETLNKIVKARVEVKQNLNIDVESLT